MKNLGVSLPKKKISKKYKGDPLGRQGVESAGAGEAGAKKRSFLEEGGGGGFLCQMFCAAGEFLKNKNRLKRRFLPLFGKFWRAAHPPQNSAYFWNVC